MKISQKGLNLIKNFEGCRLKAYKPVALEKYWTIGWGHYGPDVKEGMTITQERADELLVLDVVAYENEVNKTCKYLKLNQNQFDALVSFTFNCGAGNLLRLTGNKTRSTEEIAEHITAYNKGAGGGELAGLTRRREAELELYLTPDNIAKFDFLGINRFHEKGYKGQNVVIVSRESLSRHGSKVVDVIRQVAPYANIMYKLNYQTGELNNIDVYTTSAFQISDGYEKSKKASKEMADNNVFLCCAVGNEGEDGITHLLNQHWWNFIGACNLVDGKVQRMYYSSVGEELDYMSFSNIYTADGMFTGTSCATPVFASMVALAQSFFIKKLGRKLTNDEMTKFIKDNCIDLGENGKDERNGEGLFILPDPDTIDVQKYIEEEEDVKRFQKIEEMPSYSTDTIKKLVDKGILKGNENGLDLSEDMIRMFVIMDRNKMFD